MIRFLLGVLFPPKCILCRRVLRVRETDLCHTCREQEPIWHPVKRKLQFLDSFTAVWYYKGNVRRSILRYKFHRARYLAPGYGRRLAMVLHQRCLEDVDLITWVPVSALRRFTRGYDQGELLARALSREMGMDSTATLKKVRHNKKQSGLGDISQRRANVLGVYRVLDPEAVRGKRVLLLDDVLTTGATAGECARMLLTAGAKEVHCAALAAALK